MATLRISRVEIERGHVRLIMPDGSSVHWPSRALLLRWLQDTAGIPKHRLLREAIQAIRQSDPNLDNPEAIVDAEFEEPTVRRNR